MTTLEGQHPNHPFQRWLRSAILHVGRDDPVMPEQGFSGDRERQVVQELERFNERRWQVSPQRQQLFDSLRFQTHALIGVHNIVHLGINSLCANSHQGLQDYRYGPSIVQLCVAFDLAALVRSSQHFHPRRFFARMHNLAYYLQDSSLERGDVDIFRVSPLFTTRCGTIR